MIEHRNLWIDGAWVPSTGHETLTVINPATEKAVGTVPRGTAQDVDRAVSAATRAFADWSRTSIAERATLFETLARLTEARAEDITRTLVTEVGYPVTLAHPLQTLGGVAELALIAQSLPQIAWEHRFDQAVALVREPAGVVGGITAWNAPLRSIISKAGAAMAAGCTVVLKPSEVAPLTAFVFAQLCEEAGIPPGVFNLVCGTGVEVGEAMATHPLIDMVSLTGSVRAGQRVMQLAAGSVKRVHLELGGKSPNIILDNVNDEDFARAVQDGIADALRNAGQVCGGLTRMLVPRRRLQAAETLAVQKAQSYVLGDPFDPRTTLGPVSTEAARNRIRAVITQAQQEGIRLLTGGAQAPADLPVGWYVQPTVFSGDNTSRLAREEIFGPVVIIIPFDDEDDAVRIANDSDYGLAAGVWSASADHARAVARRLRVGRVRINGAPLDKRGTHGGFKLSGVGREWGRVGIEEFTEYKSVHG